MNFARWRRALSLLLAGSLGVLAPATPTWAATGLAQGVLYETLENPPAHAAPLGPLPGTYNPATGERQAQASETGTLQGTGTLGSLTGSIQVHAGSRVPFDPTTATFGAGGTVSGVFQLDGPAGAVVGKLNGTLDLSLLTSTACAGKPCPFAPTNGQWVTLGQTKMQGQFVGLFLLPFELQPGLWAYWSPTTGLEFVQPSEWSQDGAPLVKLSVTLWQ
jgi:hypothetical protein